MSTTLQFVILLLLQTRLQKFSLSPMSVPSASFHSCFDFEADNLHAIAAEQRCKLMSAKAVDSDLKVAYNLQLQDAISASLSLQPQSSTSSAAAAAAAIAISRLQPKEDASKFTDAFSDELIKLEQKLETKVFGVK